MTKRLSTLLIISITIMFILTSGCVNSQNEINTQPGSQNVYTVPTPVLIPPPIISNPSPTPTIIANINK
jgi:hypothetical protein